MRNQLSADTDTVHVEGAFVAYLDYYWGDDSYKKKETGFEHQDIVCFVKQSEGDMVHTETVCFISS